MNNLIVESTINTPTIKFGTDGRLLMEGRSLPEDVAKFYQPLLEWATKLTCEVVKMDINLEYINSASAKKILELLKIFDANNHIKEFIVIWHYEKDDEDVLENGQIFEELLGRAVFRYQEYED
jgi:uncharacterized protein YqhQ